MRRLNILAAAVFLTCSLAWGERLPGMSSAHVLGQELTPSTVPPGAVFFDSATVDEDEALAAHTPDLGLGWALNEDTTIVKNGTHTLTAVAQDYAGNTTISAGVSVTVSQAPQAPAVSILKPVEGSYVSGQVSIAAPVNRGFTVSSVQFMLDGGNLGARDVSAPFTTVWDTRGVAEGPHTLTAVAEDAAGRTTTSIPVAITVQNTNPVPATPGADTTKPVVSISSPADGATLSGVVPVAATVSDNIGIKSVQFRLDGNNLGGASLRIKPPYTALWNIAAGVGPMKVAKGRDWLSPIGDVNSARVSYYALPNPALGTPDYYVQVSLDNEANGSPDDFAWLMLRRTDVGTFYGAGWYASNVPNDCYIFKVVSGRYTELANRDCGFVDGDVIKFSVAGDTLTLFRNGASVLTAVGGSDISAIGAGGFGYGNIRNASDDTAGALALDDFLIAEGNPGASALPPPSTPIAPSPITGPATTTPPPAPTPPPPTPPPVSTPTTPVLVLPGNHGYFNSLVARPEHWRSFSLRDAAQIALYRRGRRTDVEYLFPQDSDPRQQDAAKVVVADYANLGNVVLASPMSESDTVMVTGGGLPAAPGLAYKVDNEVLLYVSRVIVDGQTRTTVQRGQHGTRPTSHATGVPVGTGSNSLQSQVRVPMGTEDGHNYLITWDAWYGAETKRASLTNWKTFQFAQGTSGDGSLGLEVRTRFDGGSSPKLSLSSDELAQVDMRRYLAVEDSSLSDQLGPTRTPFAIKTETWTRYWVFIEHVVGDWDRVSLWMADTTRAPVQVLNRVAFEADTHTFRSFWVEFNTSTDRVVPNRGPLVNYVKNIVMLRDVTNPTALMAMPVATSSTTSPETLSAPRNLRIVTR